MSILRLPVGSINADYYQTPHPTQDYDPAEAVIKALTKAKFEVHFAIYSLTHKGIAAALLAAHERGLLVIGVADVHEVTGATSQVPALAAAGLNITKWGGNYRLMHDKSFVLDPGTSRCTVGLGSFNWTTQAEKSNIEMLLIARGVQVARTLGPAMQAQIDTAHAAGSPI